MPFAPATDWRRLPPEAKQQFLEALQRKTASKVGEKFKRVYRNDPAAFVRDCFSWSVDEGPAEYQIEILSSLVDSRRVAVRGPHGLGKTSLASWVILWFALTRDGGEGDWKIVTTASAWRQLKNYLWPEVHKWARRLRWSKILRPAFSSNELLQLSLKLQSGEAFAVATNDHELIEGAHADSLLYLFDEAKAIPTDFFDAAEGALSSGDCYALAISTPGEPVGRFYDIHARKPGLEGWRVRHVTLKEATDAGRVSRAWAKEKKSLWGEGSAIYANRVLGEFHTSDSDGVIPLSWIEQANERWEAWRESKDQWLSFTCVGVDVGRSTDGDKTILALRHGEVITELRRFSVADTMVSSGHVAAVLNARGGYGVIDLIGIGAGVYDRLREQNLKVRPFNASTSPPARMKDRSGELEFLNCRAAAWWHFRELLDPAYGSKVCLPPDDQLTGDLCAPHWKPTSSGKLQIESKDDIRKRLGRSTDDGDSVVMAFFPEPVRAAEESELYSYGYRQYGW